MFRALKNDKITRIGAIQRELDGLGDLTAKMHRAADLIGVILPQRPMVRQVPSLRAAVFAWLKFLPRPQAFSSEYVVTIWPDIFFGLRSMGDPDLNDPSWTYFDANLGEGEFLPLEAFADALLREVFQGLYASPDPQRLMAVYHVLGYKDPLT
jgi:hypothetical protein